VVDSGGGGKMGTHGGGSGGRTRVGRYELGRTLGEGTFAKVKFARNVETGENVAIKILDKEKVLKHKMIAQVRDPICLYRLIILLLSFFGDCNRRRKERFFFFIQKGYYMFR
jgi:serine/threonine protein kinase